MASPVTYAVPACLPGYVGTALLALACSRRVPALRPVAVAFAAWAILDAATGPLWLRAGVCVAWPGVAVMAALWGLRAADTDARSEARARRSEGEDGGRRLRGLPVVAERIPGDDIRDLAGESSLEGVERIHAGRRTGEVGRHPLKVAIAAAAVYLIAGTIVALSYRANASAIYHALLPLSRLSTLPFAAYALLSRPWSRPWATRAAVTPLLGLACGVVLGVWTLLPAGLESVREQWGRLAGAETWATMVGVVVCVAGAWGAG